MLMTKNNDKKIINLLLHLIDNKSKSVTLKIDQKQLIQ